MHIHYHHDHTLLLQKLIGALTERLSRKCSVECYVGSLNTIRILSREKASVDDMATESSLKQLVIHAGLEAFDGDADEAPEKTIEEQNLPGKFRLEITKGQ